MGIFLTVLGVVLSAAGALVERFQKKADAEAAAEKVWQKHNKQVKQIEKSEEDTINEETKEEP